MDSFKKSESQILILLGVPGTGKTSFIRTLIHHCNYTPIFTYEKELMETDYLFIKFILEKENLLVIEDADLLLTTREKHLNEIMSKFLNLSDGLVSTKGKKIIFTANIIDKSIIDPALLRVGRCFDCSIFRALTYDEMIAAADVAGISRPNHNDGCTLSDLFRDSDVPKVEQHRAIGF